MRHEYFSCSAVKIISNTAINSGETAMNKVLGLALVIYLLGDPSLSMLGALRFDVDYIIALIVALITIPWVTSQLEN
jgi:hypothetical protein